MTFGKWLYDRRKDARLTQGQLAERSGLSASYISALEREEPNARNGDPRRPRIEQVERLAKALQVDYDEARLAAGYAPKNAFTKPQTLPELISALEALGLDMPLFYDDLPDDPEAFQETIERIYLDVKLVIERSVSKSKERRLQEIQDKLIPPPVINLEKVEVI